MRPRSSSRPAAAAMARSPFAREKYVPRGGPDGGDGGRGGSVVFAVRSNLKTLSHLKLKRVFKAENGKRGGGQRMSGKDGRDVEIPVPPGTILQDAEIPGDPSRTSRRTATRFVLLRGGRGGKGNSHYATSINQAPRYAQKGVEGESREVRVELHLIADVGLVGLPNAGKSTLLSLLTNARPLDRRLSLHDESSQPRAPSDRGAGPDPCRHSRDHRRGLPGPGAGPAVSPPHREVLCAPLSRGPGKRGLSFCGGHAGEGACAVFAAAFRPAAPDRRYKGRSRSGSRRESRPGAGVSCGAPLFHIRICADGARWSSRRRSLASCGMPAGAPRMRMPGYPPMVDARESGDPGRYFQPGALRPPFHRGGGEELIRV